MRRASVRVLFIPLLPKSFMFDGFILRKPRIASSASPFTAAPDVVVLDNDRSEYLAEYVDAQDPSAEEFLVVPASTSSLIVAQEEQEEQLDSAINEEGTLFQFNEEGFAIRDVTVSPVPEHLNEDAGIIRYDNAPGSVTVKYYFDPISLWYTKNDETTRFDFDVARDRWRPLPGSSPDALGVMPEDGIVELATVEFPRDHRIMLGHPSAGQEIILEETDWEDEFDESLEPGPGDVVAFIDTGEVWFGSDFVDDYFGGPVYQFRQDFFEFDDSTGQIGEVGDELLLNPIPEQGNRPLIRIEYGTHLPVKTGNSSGDIDADHPVVWDENTGQVFVDDDLFREGQAVYYDGVYVVDDPIYSPEPDPNNEVAEISSTFFASEVEFTTDIDPEVAILFLPETGLCFEEVEIVDDTDDFLRSFELPEQKAQVHVDGNTMTVRLPHSFASQYSGEDLAVTTGDFPLEKGITFRMFRSPVDLANERGIPDVTDRIRVTDEEVIDSVRPGTFASVVQIPLQNIGGYGENLFFRLQDGPRRRLLTAEENVVYDFDNDRLLWTEHSETSKLITSPTPSIKLDHEVLYDGNFTFELNEGQGFEELVPSEDILVDFDSGELSFSDLRGGTIYDGIGRVDDAGSGEFEFRTVDLDENDFDFPVTDERFLPLLVLEERDEVYRIEDVDETANTITVHIPFGFEQDAVAFEVIEAPELVFEHSLRPLTLNRRWVFPKKISAIETGDFVPDGETFSFRDANNTELAHEILRSETLGTLAEHDDETFELPSYFQESGSNFTVYREAKELTGPVANPDPDEYGLTGSGQFVFNPDDVENNPDAAIVLDPQLSDPNHDHTNLIEVLHENREVGFHDDLGGVDVSVVVQLRQNQYTVQPRNGVIFFNSAFRSGDQLEVDYFTDEETQITETLGFKTTETLNVDAGDASSVFASGVNVHPDRPAQVLVNGAPVGGSISIDEDGVATAFFDPIRANRIVQVQYSQLDAKGGERISQLGERPFFPPVDLEEGPQQHFYGNHLDVLSEDTVLQFDDEAYVVQSLSYDATDDVTNVTLYPPVREEHTTNSVLGSTKPVGRDAPVVLEVDDNSEDEQEIRVSGDVSDEVDPFDVLFLDDAPHFVSGVLFEEDDGVTLIQFRNVLLREFTDPVVHVSKERVYPPDTETLLTEGLAFAETQPHKLIRFDAQDNGQLLDPESQYEFLDAGSIILDPTNIDLPGPDERWFMSYLARREIGPTVFKGRRIVPQFRAEYTRFINASTDNGIEGSALMATYSYSSPDAFYFRALELDNFRGEVADNLASGAEGLSSGSGTTASFGGDLDLHEQGENTLIWTEGHLYDQDRVARRFINFYNTIAQLLESYLQTADGRIVGDRDGQFRFRVEDAEDQPDPGQTDPITGRLRPYYVSPEGDGLPIWQDSGGQDLSASDASDRIKNIDVLAQEGYVRNAMDDIIMVSKRPFDRIWLGLGSIAFVFEGTFKPMWRPHKLSRLYPQRSNVATITPPPVDDGDNDYSFRTDRGETLGDLQQDDVMNVESLSDRPPRAWITQDGVQSHGGGDEIRIEAGMFFPLGDSDASNQDGVATLEDGDPSRLVPGFREGDVVALGRSSIVPDKTTGLFDRNNEIYAALLVVTHVGDDHLRLGEFSASALVALGFAQSVADDIIGDIAFASIEDLIDGTTEVQKNDTIFGVELTSYGGRDYGVDGSEGELTNRILPSFMASLLNQDVPDPETELDATISYKNQRTEPFRFPALDGEPVDDDGLMAVPYIHPLADSEAAYTGDEASLWTELLHQTTPGLNTRAQVVEPYALRLPDVPNLTDDPAQITPRRYDKLFLEGIVSAGESVPFYVSDVVDGNLVYLATYDVEESDISYTVDNVIEGQGERDVSDLDTWLDDGGQDFTSLDAALSASTTFDATLVIDGSEYNIEEFGDGFIRVDTNISETDGDYSVSISSTGFIEGDLHTFTQSGSIDLGPYSLEGLTLDLNGQYNDGEYTIVEVDESDIFVEVVPPLQVGTQTGAAFLNNPILLDEAQGQTLDPTTFWQDLDPSTTFTDFDDVVGPIYLHVLGQDSDVSTYEVIDIVSDDVIEVDRDIEEDDDTFDYVLTLGSSFAIGNAGVLVVDDSGPSQEYLFEPNDQRLYVDVERLDVLNIAVGDRLIIGSDSPNGNHYQVEGFGTYEDNGDEIPYIELDRSLRDNETATTPASDDDIYPVRWYSYRPRRLDPVLDELEETFLRRWVLYQDPEDAPEGPRRDISAELLAGGYEAKNPSTPSLNVLEELIEVVFGIPEVEALDGEVFEDGGEWKLESPSLTSGVSDDDPISYVLVDFDAGANEPSPARGFFRVESLDDPLNPTTITLSDGFQSFYDDKTAGWIDRIGTDTDVEFRVYTVDEFSERTYELILYEYYNVLSMLQRLHAGLESTQHQTGNFLDFFDEEFGVFPGDPTNEIIANHLFGQYLSIPVGVLDRQEWVRGRRGWTREDPDNPSDIIEEGDGIISVVNEIEAILKGREALYDLRFSWIDFRTNLEDGTLPSIDRFKDRRRKEEEKIRKDLLKIL